MTPANNLARRRFYRWGLSFVRGILRIGFAVKFKQRCRSLKTKVGFLNNSFGAQEIALTDSPIGDLFLSHLLHLLGGGNRCSVVLPETITLVVPGVLLSAG